jgi:hypothetical protein
VIALVAALVGTASALPGRNSVDGGDIKADSVKRSDIADDALTPRRQVGVAPNPRTATDPCEGGETAVFCGSTGGGGYWENVGGSFAEVTYYADATGVVHLGGTAVATSPGNLGRMFILPPAFRPDGDRAFSVACGVATPNQFEECTVFVQADGIVWRAGGDGFGVALDGITFAAG